MKFTLITACRNAAATIGDTLASIAAQDYLDFELLVMDGASSDSTCEAVRRFAAGRPELRVRLYSEADRNVYEAWNKALALAEGEIIGFLNADDVFADARVLSRIAQAFHRNAVDCIYGDLDFVSRDDPRRVVRRWRSRPYVARAGLRGWHPPHPTLYVKRAVYRRIGGFDPRFPMAADVQFMVRLFELARASSLHIPVVLVRMRAGGISNGSLRKHVVANWQCWRAARAAGLPVSPFYMVRKPLSRVGQFLRRDWRDGDPRPC